MCPGKCTTSSRNENQAVLQWHIVLPVWTTCTCFLSYFTFQWPQSCCFLLNEDKIFQILWKPLNPNISASTAFLFRVLQKITLKVIETSESFSVNWIFGVTKNDLTERNCFINATFLYFLFHVSESSCFLLNGDKTIWKHIEASTAFLFRSLYTELL